MKKGLVFGLIVLAVVSLTALAVNQLTDLAVSGLATFNGGTTLYSTQTLASSCLFIGDMDLNDILDIDTTDDTYFAANIATTGDGGGLYVNSTGTGNIVDFAHDGTTVMSIPDGGVLTFADASKPTKRLYLPIDNGGGTSDTEVFENSPSINIDTDDETWYASVPVPADWDGASDMNIYFMIANEIAETDGDDIDITMQIRGYADGETMAANGQAPACSTNLTGGDEAIDIVNLCTAVIDWNDGTYDIAVDDIMVIKCSMALAAGTEVTGPMHIIAWWIEYTADQLSQ